MADCPGCASKDQEILLLREELVTVRGERKDLLDRLILLANPAAFRVLNPLPAAEREVRRTPPRPNFPGFFPNRRPHDVPASVPAVPSDQADGTG